ncbi:polysaccharide deacetylase family protein [Holdemania sp. 1001095H_141210_F2]|uniref:polysaccharide deacetylase family protein n=1 Tax=Holdemania sp. 1001095H_141210_F2 TaxID=2787149 RepID=UPI0018A12067|nr:polysaccharide deacetylase family protein [Holdemania sp. 1001095H_141210_F2]
MKIEAKNTKRQHRSSRLPILLFSMAGIGAAVAGSLFLSTQGWSETTRPSFLEAEDRQLDQALHEKQDAAEIVVFYPQEPQAVQATARQQAGLLMSALSTAYAEWPAASQEDPKPILIKADYHTEALAQNTMSVVYLIQKKVGDHIEEEHWGYMLDQQTGELIGAEQAFDQTGLERISALFRDAMKNQEATRSLAYTLPFIQASAPTAENFSRFYSEGDQLTFLFDLPVPTETLKENGEAEREEETSHDEVNIDAESKLDKSKQETSEQESIHLDPESPLQWSLDRAQLGSHFLLKPAEDSGNLFIPPRTVDPDRPMVALTFDDGPHPKNTPRILEALRASDGACTFFMVGTNVELYPDVVKAVAESGSEIASHTYSHPNLTKLSNDRLNYQLNRVSELVSELTGRQIQVKTLRPPYGAVSEQVKEASALPLILWSMDTLDWKTRDAQKTISHVLENVEDGDIILMHDIHAESADAAAAIIPQLTAMGYQLVTVQELMEAKGLEMLPGQKIFSGHPASQ